MFLIFTLHNKIFISADFESKNFARFFRFSANFRSNFFDSKSTEMKILLCKVNMRNKLYEIKIFELCCNKMELMKQIQLFEKGFVIFLKGDTFSDFINTRLFKYITSGIKNRFSLFWRIYFQELFPHSVLKPRLSGEHKIPRPSCCFFIPV